MKIKFYIAAVLVFLSCKFMSGQNLRINEIMSSNVTAIADEDGDFEDWIELYNGTDSIINLKNYRLSDKLTIPDKWIFPEILIYPDQYLLIFASDKNKLIPPHLHTNFKISIDGEYILLSDSIGNPIDAFPPVVLSTDNSYGRYTDGNDNLIKFDGSSPGSTNNNLFPLIPYNDKIIFSQAQGLYNMPFVLNISNIIPEAKIYYTLNGSEPDTLSILYQLPVHITEKTYLPNNLSSIPTNTSQAQHPYHWRPPSEKVFKGTVIKARSFINGEPQSKTYTASYFVNENIFEKYNGLPFISIVIDSLSLFDYNKGIYVPGKLHDDNPNYPDWWGYGNYFGRGMDWERMAHISFFEGTGQVAFSQNIGIRIHGNSSRALPLKTLRLYARNLYGKKSIDYKFFSWKNVESYRRIQLSSSGNDFPYNMFADALASVLTKDFNFEKQDYRPAVVFINGEFWGIQNIRDRIDEYFFEYTFGILPDDIDFMYYWDVASIGSATDFNNMIEFIKKNDMADDAAYNIVTEMIDIDNFIDYMIAKQYTAVYDWPGNNINIWRQRSNNGKWRWIFFDNDQCFTNYKFDAITHSTLEGGTTWPNPDQSTFLLRNLYKNKHFTQLYLNKFEEYLTHTFTEENINFLIDSITSMLEPAIQEHIKRWQYPISYKVWQDNVQKMRDFAKYRPCFMKKHLYQHFNITDSSYAASVCVDITIPEDSIPPPVDMSDGLNKNITTYPNPVKGILNLNFAGYNEKYAECYLYDMCSRIIFETRTEINHNKEICFSVNHFSNGIYILKIIVGTDVQYKKIIIE